MITLSMSTIDIVSMAADEVQVGVEVEESVIMYFNRLTHTVFL